ncbi:MAG TPA: response regulator [Woeseiaceae bacterium]|nr:response regulator [Woeseiaceae bacterium]
MQHRIVSLLDSDKAIGEALTALLGTYGISVATYRDAQSFEQEIRTREPNVSCLLIDASQPDVSSFSLLRRIREYDVDTPVLVMIPAARDDIRRRAFRDGATDVIEKQFTKRDLVGRILELLNGDMGTTRKPTATIDLESDSGFWRES